MWGWQPNSWEQVGYLHVYLSLRHPHPGMKSVLHNLFPEHSLVKDAPAAEQHLLDDENQDGNQVCPLFWSKLKVILKSYKGWRQFLGRGIGTFETWSKSSCGWETSGLVLLWWDSLTSCHPGASISPQLAKSYMSGPQKLANISFLQFQVTLGESRDLNPRWSKEWPAQDQHHQQNQTRRSPLSSGVIEVDS